MGEMSEELANWISDITQEDFSYFVDVVCATKRVFLLEYHDSIKAMLTSDVPNLFRNMQDFGYSFYFIHPESKYMIEGTELVTSEDETIFDFMILGQDKDRRCALYHPDEDALVISCQNMVRFFGSNTINGMLEFHNTAYFVALLDHVFERYIVATSATVGGCMT